MIYRQYPSALFHIARARVLVLVYTYIIIPAIQPCICMYSCINLHKPHKSVEHSYPFFFSLKHCGEKKEAHNHFVLIFQDKACKKGVKSFNKKNRKSTETQSRGHKRSSNGRQKATQRGMGYGTQYLMAESGLASLMAQSCDAFWRYFWKSNW